MICTQSTRLAGFLAFLVALPAVPDLFPCAKHLFVAAVVTIAPCQSEPSRQFVLSLCPWVAARREAVAIVVRRKDRGSRITNRSHERRATHRPQFSSEFGTTGNDKPSVRRAVEPFHCQRD